MRLRRSTPAGGLLVGLIALVAFASAAVALASRQPTARTLSTPAATTVAPDEAAFAAGRRRGLEGVRGFRDGDGRIRFR